MVADLREIKNFPIFLLNLIDLISVSSGIFLSLLAKEFVSYPNMDFFSRNKGSFSSIATRYVNYRYRTRAILLPVFAEQFSYYFANCITKVFGTRLAEYGVGVCNCLLAYERYILVTKPVEKDLKLSTPQRRRQYIFAVVVILTPFLTDLAVRIEKDER